MNINDVEYLQEKVDQLEYQVKSLQRAIEFLLPDGIPIKYCKAFPNDNEDFFFKEVQFKRDLPKTYRLDERGLDPTWGGIKNYTHEAGKKSVEDLKFYKTQGSNFLDDKNKEAAENAVDPDEYGRRYLQELEKSKSRTKSERKDLEAIQTKKHLSRIEKLNEYDGWSEQKFKEKLEEIVKESDALYGSSDPNKKEKIKVLGLEQKKIFDQYRIRFEMI